MKVVIDISEDVYTRLFDNGIETSIEDRKAIETAIRVGTPLPKGHGRLVDAEDVKENHRRWIGYLDEDMIARLNIAIDIHVKTIIEADKESEYGMEWIDNYINEIVRKQVENKERALAELITNYDFIVGSMGCKYKLMDSLPEGANIVCSPYIASPTMIYAIKKFDVMDLSKESPQFEALKGDET